VRIFRLFLSALLTLSCGSVANASLINDQVTFYVYTPETGGSFGPQNAIVGAGVEFAAGNAIDVDFGASSILVSSKSNWMGMHLLEYEFTDLNPLPAGLKIDTVFLTVFKGPTSGFQLSNTDDSISLVSPEFASPIAAGDPWFRLDMRFSRANDVPEPSALVLWSSFGVAGIASWCRRRLTTGTKPS
jgi:hypothetical protein